MSQAASQKRRQFADHVFAGCSLSDAYRRVYPASTKWKPHTVWTKASAMAKHGEVLGRLTELRGAVTEEVVATKERACAHIARMMFATWSELVDSEGYLTPEALGHPALEHIEFELTPDGRPYLSKGKRASAKGLFDSLAKAMGWNAEADTAPGFSLADLIDEVKRRETAARGT